jgi:cytochrome b subunit of formate dehydrogenase
MAARVMEWWSGGPAGVAGVVHEPSCRPGDTAGRRNLARVGLHVVGVFVALLVAVSADAQEAPAPIERQVCSECHEVERLRTMVHGPDVACLSCHAADSHREMPRDSTVAARDRSALCASCHSDLQPTHTTVTSDAPVCTDCHAAHTDPPVAEAIPLIAQRCGACHDDELSAFMGGAHAASIDPAGPNADVPSCQACHPSHDPAWASRRGARLEATALCIRCHSDELLIGSYDLPELAAASYEDDFHGTTLQYLWNHPDGDPAQPEILICSDCHGEHDVTWLATDAVVGVCLECHEGADERIAGAWIGHDKVGPDNAVLIWAIRLFYYSFVPLVLGGLTLNIMLEIGHWRRQKRQGISHAAHAHSPNAGISVTRFGLGERIEHFLAMTTFTLLVVTGLPQLWPENSVADATIGLFGGIGSTRVIHRFTGVLFIGLLAVHVVRALARAIRNRRLPIMFATKKDFTDTIQTVRYFLGLAPAPRIGKFDFRARFEYWGLFLGGTLMSVTGIMLLFPEIISWVVPGSVIAAGRVLHGLEGTFAVLVVILWHSWTVILRPEIFPLDKSIFTGKMEMDRLREEHALEYERIFGTEAGGASASERASASETAGGDADS